MTSQGPVAQSAAGQLESATLSQETDGPAQRNSSARAPSPKQEKSITHSPASTHYHQVEGALGDILWALICVSVPMLILTAVFTGLVYTYEVSNRPGVDSNLLSTRSSLDSDVYYIDYSATRLITVSSWTSTVTSFTSTCIMTLVSYPLAKSYLRRSQSGPTDGLPTTYQLRLIVGLVSGGFGALFSWL